MKRTRDDGSNPVQNPAGRTESQTSVSVTRFPLKKRLKLKNLDDGTAIDQDRLNNVLNWKQLGNFPDTDFEQVEAWEV